MNPIAAFCCLGMKIKALGELINREVLVPFANSYGFGMD